MSSFIARCAIAFVWNCTHHPANKNKNTMVFEAFTEHCSAQGGQGLRSIVIASLPVVRATQTNARRMRRAGFFMRAGETA